MSRSAASSVPLLLAADSRPLLAPRSREAPMQRLRRSLGDGPVRAAYLSASSRDDPAYFDLFHAAMERVGITERRCLAASLGREDAAWLERADLILLSGGDPLLGWERMQRSGTVALVRRRFAEGAALAGVSAGAMQLGLGLWSEDDTWCPTFGFAPYQVDVHDERAGWARLHAGVRRAPARVGLGIPSGGVALVYPRAHSPLEPLEEPLLELAHDGTRVLERVHPPKPGG